MSGRDLRLRRLHRHGPRLLVAPLDHPMAMGPLLPRARDLDDLVAGLARGGADAVVLHKGAVGRVDPRHWGDLALVVHLNGSTPMAGEPDEKYLVCSVEEALRAGADMVSVHVNVGARTEARQLQDLADVAADCDRWGVPLMAMAYPRGPLVADPYDPTLVQHAVTVAAELGADVVKTVQVADPADLRAITASCPVPVIVAGGAPRERDADLVADVEAALAAGAGGVALGRCLFQSDDPARTTRAVARLVHRPSPWAVTQEVDHDRPQAVLA
ncbi:2-amino-3,7-dideoxy-D-threo-hept-6-ulosonate synthase [Nocardioides marinquilinus]|uniref:2-amino-3,7-dideoxy-D-threo-hept-6-ulosonate synthase n=1 Tax=Nocardioides marinquilinus TaxID=1210400 RepID=A0ABP9Q1B1_9ACTN